jgi:hypothetical protein
MNEPAGVYLTCAELMMNDLRTQRPRDFRLSINELLSQIHSSAEGALVSRKIGRKPIE